MRGYLSRWLSVLALLLAVAAGTQLHAAEFTVTDLTTDASVGVRGVLGYWDDSAVVRVAGSAVAGDTVTLSLAGTQDMGSTDSILMPSVGVFVIGPGSGSLTLQNARFAIVGVGGTANPFYLAGVTIDLHGEPKLPDELTPHAGDMHTTVLRATGVLEDIAIIDSAGRAAETLFTWQVAPTDEPTALLCRRVTAAGSANDCISAKSSASIIGQRAEGSKLIMIECSASDPGTASNSQAMTSHDGIGVIGHSNHYTWNNAGLGMAVSTVDNTRHVEINLRAFGPVQGVTFMKGGTIDLDGTFGRLAFNGDCEDDTYWGFLRVRNWDTGNVDYDAIRLNSTDPRKTHVFEGILFDGANGALVRSNGTARGKYIFRDCATINGSTGIDRVFRDAGATLTLSFTGCAFQTSGYSVQDSGSITIDLFENNIFEADGSGVSLPTNYNVLNAAPTAAEIEATGAKVAWLPAPTLPVQMMLKGAAATIVKSSSHDEIFRLLSGEVALLEPVDDLSLESLVDTSSVTPTTSTFAGQAADLSDVDDFYSSGGGTFVVFTSGENSPLVRPVVDYDGATRTFTVSPAFPVAPSNGDRIKLIGRP